MPWIMSDRKPEILMKEQVLMTYADLRYGNPVRHIGESDKRLVEIYHHIRPGIKNLPPDIPYAWKIFDKQQHIIEYALEHIRLSVLGRILKIYAFKLGNRRRNGTCKKIRKLP